MKILEVIGSINPAAGGPVEGIQRMAAVNAARGHWIEVATLDAPDAAYLKAFSLPVYPLGPGLLKYSYSPRLVPWLRKNASNYDAVVVNGIWQYSSYGAWRALHGTATPYVVFTHGMLDPWFKRQYPLKHIKKYLYWPFAAYQILRDAKAILFTCAEEQRQAALSFSPFPSHGVVVGYGTAAPEGKPAAQKETFFHRYPELRSKRLAVFLGRIHRKKGCDLLIQAFAQVLGKFAEWHLVIAGPDQTGWQCELKAMAQQQKISDRIVWTGMVRGDLKWGALHAAQIFVLPSHQENFGVAVAEALACGVPVLLSDQVSTWKEVIAEGAGLVAPDTLAGTKQLLQMWLDMPREEQNRMRERTVTCFQKHFEVSRSASRLIEVLQQVSGR